jgi:phospholipid/cholesterol/gamma-HCH transport system permease protein
VLEQSGRAVVSVTHEILGLLSFAGRTVLVLLKTLVNPRRLRFTSVVYHIEQTGFNAIPVAGLLCFLIGAVIAYMGITMLKLFGAGILTVELVGFVILRELGVLLVAILVAGRSGSAFTAEIGSMKSREELDALNTIGMDPIELLVVPRVLALLIALPALTFLGDVAGLIGGGMVCATELDLSDVAFLARLQEGVAGKHFFAGMVKAPVFAILIATIGCYQGFMVEGTAESVGARTTRSVVHGIFAVILADAFFAIYFMQINW